MIEVTISCQNKKFVEQIDLEDYFDGENEDYDENYFSSLKQFPVNLIAKYNGNHFIFGYWECLRQSDDFPLWLMDGDAFIEVVKI